MPISPGGPLLLALDAIWTRLRDDVPGLPAIRPTVSPTPRSTDHAPRWGRLDDGSVSGFVVSADVLQAGAEAVVETALHDAAHLLNWTRDIRDVTTRGVYHNASFLTAAEEVGLVWPDGAERIQGKGYVNPALSDAARAQYAEQLAELPDAIALALPHLELPSAPRTSRTPDRLTLACSKCEPPRKLRIGRTVAAQGPIICGVCNTEFTAG